MTEQPANSGDQLPLEGSLEPPMINGEVAFEAPWQGRVFGMARVLAERGYFSWDDFRAHLIREIGVRDRAVADGMVDPGEAYRYYDHFLAALQTLLAARGLLEPGTLEGRVQSFAARPHDHDHHHGH